MLLDVTSASVSLICLSSLHFSYSLFCVVCRNHRNWLNCCNCGITNSWKDWQMRFPLHSTSYWGKQKKWIRSQNGQPLYFWHYQEILRVCPPVDRRKVEVTDITFTYYLWVKAAWGVNGGLWGCEVLCSLLEGAWQHSLSGGQRSDKSCDKVFQTWI